MKQQNGFSLIELMIAIVIVGILASIAIPNYSSYMIRSRIPEATAGLGDIRVRMEQFFQDNRTYPVDGCAPTATATILGVVAGDSFGFTCDTMSATTYRVIATGTGSMAGFVYTLNQTNGRTSVFSGKAVTAGYITPSTNNCWVTKAGGTC